MNHCKRASNDDADTSLLAVCFVARHINGLNDTAAAWEVLLGGYTRRRAPRKVLS